MEKLKETLDEMEAKSTDVKTSEKPSSEELENVATETDAKTIIFPWQSKKEEPRVPSIAAMSIYYNMHNDHRGVAVIFNHYEYDDKKMPVRKGTDKDCDRMAKTLQGMGFDVHVHHDLRYLEILSFLDKVASMDHTNNDCLMVVVMSHGEEGGTVHARDKKYPVDELWKGFVGYNCQTLVGKPKLFFIQACRGESFDEGVQFKESPFDKVDSHMSKKEEVIFTVPKMADLLVMYSTYDGHFSWRNPVNGSWFIQSLCDEFIENGSSVDLLNLLTSVTRRVAYQYQSYNPNKKTMDGMKQMPCIVSMLTRMMYFTPKLRKVTSV